jgi:hypothetical protein
MIIISQFNQVPEAIDMFKRIGNILIGMGIVMLFWGYSAFRGSSSDKALGLLIGGGACAAAGAFLSFRKK